ncbi:MAG: hypothetical protein WBB28_18010 [Crinalium sp.]
MHEPSNNPLMETPDDEITTGSQQYMSHEERYRFVKNRTYSKFKPEQIVVGAKQIMTHTVCVVFILLNSI